MPPSSHSERPSPDASSTRRLVAIFSLITVAMPCLGVAVTRASALMAAGRQGFERLHGSDFEGLRRAYYGDCGGRGYGYVTRVLEGYPEPDMRPRVRYPDYDRDVHVVLPAFRPRVDERVLIAIDVPDALSHDERIAVARRTDELPAPASRWLFATKWEFDLFTAARVQLERPLEQPTRFDVVLRHSTLDPSPLARWHVELPAGAGPLLTLGPDRPFERFSYTRGGIDFVLDVTVGDPGVSIVAVEAIGVRVDTRGYTVVRRDGGCFVAVRTDLLEAIRGRADDPWSNWLERVRRGG